MAKIIVVSLVYNKKRFLGDCVVSVASQGLQKKDFLHLLVDNNSTDGADKICEVFAKKYSHIRFEKMGRNLGQMPAYNWVLNKWIPRHMPEAEVMVQLDADDMMTPIALAEVSRKFDDNPDVGHTYSDFSIVNSMGKLKDPRTPAHPKAKQVDPKIELTEQGQRVLRSWELRFNIVGHLRAMRISSVRAIGGFDEKWEYATDVNMACRMLSSPFKVSKIPKILCLWREHGKEQVQGNVSEKQTRCWREIVFNYSEKWKIEGLI